MPRIQDKTSGVWRRMIPIPFRKEIDEGNQISGLDKDEWWTVEVPGILNWAIRGLIELESQDRFILPNASRALLGQSVLESNPAKEFLSNDYCIDPDLESGTSYAELYQGYRDFCVESGYKPLGSAMFGKECKRFCVQGKRVRRTWQGSTGRSWIFLGIIRKPPEPL